MQDNIENVMIQEIVKNFKHCNETVLQDSFPNDGKILIYFRF